MGFVTILHRVVALAMVAVLLGAGCAQKQTFVYGADLHLGLRQLKATGAAQVSTHERVDGKLYDPEPETVKLSQEVELLGQDITIAKLTEFCDEDYEAVQDKRCLLRTHVTTEIVLRGHVHDSGATHVAEAVGNTLLGVGVIASITCGIACDAPISTVSWIGLGVMALLALASCIHNATCHD